MENKEKELSFKEKLEKDISQQLHRIHNMYVPMEDKEYDIMTLQETNCHIGNEVINIAKEVVYTDFKDYKFLLDALIKTIQLYYKNGYINDEIQIAINKELNILITTSHKALSKNMQQYKTLVTCANSLTDLLKFINSYDTNTKIEQMKNSISTKEEIKTTQELYIKDIENYIELSIARNKVEEEIMKCLGARYKEYCRCFLRECLEVEEVNDMDKISINAKKIGIFLKDISQNIELIIKE